MYCRRLLDLPSTSEKNEAKAMLRELNQLKSSSQSSNNNTNNTGRRRSSRLGRNNNNNDDARVV